MFDSLITYKRVALGNSGIMAVMTSDPTLAVVRKIQDGMEANADSVRGSIFPLAVLIDRWEGDGAPDAQLWPRLTDEAALEQRFIVLENVPTSILRQMMQEAVRSMGLTEAERDSSGKPSE